jgi:phage-related protein
MPSQATVRILSDTSQFDNGLEGDLSRILERIEQRLPPITVHAQLASADEQRIHNQLRDITNDRLPEFELHVRLSQADVNQVRADLIRLTSANIPDIVIPVRLNDDDFQRTLARLRGTNIPDIRVRVNGPDTNVPIKRIADMVTALATIAPAAVSASVAMVGALSNVASASLSASVAVAAFAAAVVPQLKDVTDVTEKYDKAQEAAAMGAKDAAKKQQEYEKALKALQPATRDTAKSFIGLRNDFKKWSDGLASSTMPTFTKAIELLRSLLPKLTPLVKVASKQFSLLIDNLQKGVDNGGFAKFIDRVTEASKTTLPAFIRSVRNIATGLAGIGRAFGTISKSGGKSFEGLTKSFAEWGKSLKDNQGFQDFVKQFQGSGPQFRETLANIAKIVANLIQALAPFSGVLLKVAVALSTVVAAIPVPVLTAMAYAFAAISISLRLYAAAAAVATAATWLFSTANGASNVQMALLRIQMIALRVQQALVATWTGVVTAAQWAWNAAMTANPIGIMIVAIAALVAAIVIIATKTKFFQTVWSATWGFVKTKSLAVWNWMVNTFNSTINAIKNAWSSSLRFISSLSSSIWNGVKSKWNSTINSIKSSFTASVNAIKNAWSASMSFIRTRASETWNFIRTKIVGSLASAYSGVINQVGNIKSKISGLKNSVIGYFRNASSWLYKSGQALVRGFISGIGSMVSRAVDKVKSLVSKVRDYLPFSPAKEGPLSGRGYTTYSGKALIEGFMQGIDKAAPGLQQTMSRALGNLPTASPQMSLAGAQAARQDLSGLSAPTRMMQPVNNFTVNVGNEALDARMVRIVEGNNADRDRREFQGMRY